MKARNLFVTLLTLFLLASGFAQQKYWVYFTDKNEVSFDPYTYFDSKAITRRIKTGVPINDISDYPLNESYIAQVVDFADTITGQSRWLNAVAIVSSDEKIKDIASFPFVRKVESMYVSASLAMVTGETMHQGEEELAKAQLDWMQGSTFIDSGYTGKGIRICIIDAGFPEVDEADVFDHIRNRNGIIATWDFVKNKPDVYKFNGHGTMVMSCIAGKTDDYQLGLATDAEFLLARTEKMLSEGIKEEEYWLMAIEWADKNGADIISSSLGYTKDAYFKEDMNGKTSVITKAANIAAGKGLLVVNSAGNDGDKNWKYIGAPADADSALSIGAINPWTGLHTSFSSFGPTADHRMKPNLTAFGHVMVYNPGIGFYETQGTSFSCPLIAGFAACAWQTDTTLTNMALFQKLEESGSLFPYYDYAHGFGVPQASHFIKKKDSVEATFEVKQTEYQLEIEINPKDFSIEAPIIVDYHPYISEYLDFTDQWHMTDNYKSADAHVKQATPGYFYYSIENEEGYLDEYFVLSVYQTNILKLDLEDVAGKKVHFFYKGYEKTMEF